MAAMALTFSVASVTGKTYDVMVKGEDRVKELREEVERYIEVRTHGIRRSQEADFVGNLASWGYLTEWYIVTCIV